MAYCSRHSPRAPSPISFSTIMTIRCCRQRRLSASGSIEMAILSDQDVQQQLKNLADWTVEGRAIRKQYTFNDFPAAVAFVNRLVPEAEAADHHPDIVINYRKVTLLYSTHDEGGITQKDFDGAAMADRKASER
jgi:4a-hydroxytetrahydrobiopterin dehydratase